MIGSAISISIHAFRIYRVNLFALHTLQVIVFSQFLTIWQLIFLLSQFSYRPDICLLDWQYIADGWRSDAVPGQTQLFLYEGFKNLLRDLVLTGQLFEICEERRKIDKNDCAEGLCDLRQLYRSIRWHVEKCS